MRALVVSGQLVTAIISLMVLWSCQVFAFLALMFASRMTLLVMLVPVCLLIPVAVPSFVQIAAVREMF
jgi:hypothetical protein